MTMDQNATDAGLEQIEAKARSGDVGSLMQLSSRTLKMHLNDKAELSRVKKILLTSHNGSARALWSASVFAVLTDDLKAWNYATEMFGNNMDPGLAFIAYDFLKKSGANRDTLQKWNFLIDISARQGFILAKRDVWKQKCSNFGVVGAIVGFPYLVYLSLQVVLLLLLDRNDRRLPTSTRKN